MGISVANGPLKKLSLKALCKKVSIKIVKKSFLKWRSDEDSREIRVEFFEVQESFQL